MDNYNPANLFILWSNFQEPLSMRSFMPHLTKQPESLFPKKGKEREHKGTYVSVKQFYFPTFIKNDNPFGALFSSESTAFIWN